MATMHVSVVSAEARLFDGDAAEVYARSLDGEIGILPGHQPSLLALDIAPVKIKLADGEVELVAVHHGFLYFRENELIILADMAELAGEIDVERARAKRRELEALMEAEEERGSILAAIRREDLRIELADRE